ncbi:SDR family NAD(P)-dependent oxidoreductase [Streptomyces sp. NPDC054904]|uniref:SDR family NAD(P)-dependent oxidoreductase n=1 Tax=unclassified Streptomyces TaxID=2593676 RepID=UPI002481D820|nr:SDR family NAD(P)-dependent oxidoreductase [Streptomyces sp. Isolate_45]MDA5283780.1 SDR family oxidoreductase [Streptomyces sp. Isolate_45]
MVTRSVLVTGGSGGIGRACVERFALEEDWTVWFTYRNGRARAEELVHELALTGHAKVEAFPFDQGDWEDHQRLLERLPGPVEVLVNNAAVGSKTIDQYTDGSRHEKASEFFRINAVGPLWLTEQLLPGMLENGYGKIINISSVGGGIFQFPGFHPADGMSKAALTYLTRHLAADLVHSPVDVFAVCPGAVDTAMFQASTLDKLSPEELAALTARLPKSRLIRSEEIAELVWWLAGDHSTSLHGSVIDASMGLGVNPGLLTAAGVDSGRGR